ncbi:hypothetical protein [Herpetosiphon llansteffanensis]|uniref:hypothetical protein n=1 Tax=Herpetosiphon llansteffanensis TaxID=2094568 RepID=UPI000D7CADE9|nr:hypothetical protein [Herpetosiphon llansteffanensis]
MFGHFFKTIWMAGKYFLLGLATAALTAPQTGAESRQLLKKRILGLFDQTLPTTASTIEHDEHGAAALDKQEYWQNGAEKHSVL